MDDDLYVGWEDDTPFLLKEYDSDIDISYIQSQASKQSFQSICKDESFLKQIDEDLDYSFALSLQSQYDDEVKENIASGSKKSTPTNSKLSKPLSIIDEQWELIDPHPDIHALFSEYDTKFFYGKLKGVEVKWSPRMTLCAGVCSYEGRGGLCSVRLSVPLLKLRPRKDLVETLLHEMIHAYLFVTHNNKDRDGHGPEFLSHMTRINKETGTKITVYHSFHDEVDLYRQHWWKCDGPCKNRRPYFGVLKRARNKAPGPKDNWWAEHQANCGGKFMKIKEPENYGKKKPVKRKAPNASESKESTSDIRSFLKNDLSGSGSSRSTKSLPKSSSAKPSNAIDFKSILSSEDNVVTLSNSESHQKKFYIPFQGIGQRLGGSSDSQSSILLHSALQKNPHNKNVFPSTKNIKGNPSFKAPKIARLSNPNDKEKQLKDKNVTPSLYASTSTQKLTQSPIEKFLSSGNKAGSSGLPVKKDLNFTNAEQNVSEVPCPVCFILIKEQEINVHLDKCLLNN